MHGDNPVVGSSYMQKRRSLLGLEIAGDAGVAEGFDRRERPRVVKGERKMIRQRQFQAGRLSGRTAARMDFVTGAMPGLQ